MTKLVSNSFASGSITSSQLNIGNLNPVITSIAIADSSYTVLDDTAANTTGGYVVITGSGFTNSSTVLFRHRGHYHKLNKPTRANKIACSSPDLSCLVLQSIDINTL